MKHAHNIWLVKFREDIVEKAAKKDLEDLDGLYTAKYTLKRQGDDVSISVAM